MGIKNPFGSNKDEGESQKKTPEQNEIDNPVEEQNQNPDQDSSVKDSAGIQNQAEHASNSLASSETSSNEEQSEQTNDFITSDEVTSVGNEAPPVQQNIETNFATDTPTVESDIKETQLSEISEFIKGLKDELNLRNERDKYKDEAIQRLTKENEEYKRGLVKDIKKALVNSMIEYIDSLTRFKKRFESLGNDDLQKEIDFLIDEVLITLTEHHVEEIDEEPGTPLNRDIHKPKGQVLTSVEEEHHTIQEIVKKGFIWSDNSVIRKQEIIRRVYQPKTETND